jgi:hypothetical protein
VVVVVGGGFDWKYPRLSLAHNVGDITPGIPKYPFIMTNIYIIYQVIYAEILKSK